MPARTTFRSWFSRALQLAATVLLCTSAQAQSTLLDITNTVAASDQGVPVQQTFTITDTGTYNVTLTDLGAALSTPAPLASVKLAITNGSNVIGAPLVGAGTMQITATTPGTYVVHVIGKPDTTKTGSGSFGVTITAASNNSASPVLSFSSTLALPPSAIPNTYDVLDDSFTVPASGNYQVSLTDLHVPQALGTLTLAITVAGGSLVTTLPDQSNAYQTSVALSSGTTYRIFAIGQASSNTTGGLYSAVVSSGGTVVYGKTRPVGGVTDLGPVTLTAGTYNLSLRDLAYPAALSSVAVTVVQNGAQVAGLPLISPNDTGITVVTGPGEVFGYGAPAPSANGGAYALTLTSQQAGSTPVMSLARAVAASASATRVFSFDANLSTGGAYAFNLADFSLPAAFGSLTALVVQNNTALGSPLSGAGNANATQTVTATAGPVSLVVFAQPGTGGSLFGADLVAGTSAPAFQVTQGVGQLFSSQKFTVTTAGTYAVTLTDVGFPASLQTLAAIVTQGVTSLGAAYSGGTFGFTAPAAGDYYVTFVAQPQSPPASTDEAGTYSIHVAPAPAAPTVTLTSDKSSVASGGTVTLTWNPQGATSCNASGGWSGSLSATAGAHSQASPNITAATTFTITCYNSVQVSATASVTVNIDSSSGGGGGHSGGGALSDDLLVLLGGLVLWRAWLELRPRVPTRARTMLVALVAVGAVSVGAGNIARAEVNTVIAKGGSIELSAGDVRSLVATLPDESRKALRSNLPALEKLLRGEVVQRAVLADMRAKNFEKDPNTIHQLERVQQEALTRLWLVSRSEVPADYPAEADVKSTYEALKSSAPVEYHLAQVFISAPDGVEPTKLSAALRKATDIAGKIGTSDFAQLARTQSDHAESAAKGGDMGFVAGERLLPAVLASIKTLNAGQVAGPVKTSEGLHFIKLIETRPITIPPLQDIRQRIVADLRARRAQQLQQAYLSDLAVRLGISINEIELGKLQASLN
jgi:parvulin-like peptidyl-prolyl isomerase